MLLISVILSLEDLRMMEEKNLENDYGFVFFKASLTKFIAKELKVGLPICNFITIAQFINATNEYIPKSLMYEMTSIHNVVEQYVVNKNVINMEVNVDIVDDGIIIVRLIPC